jgi:site-specific DNA recombinase
MTHTASKRAIIYCRVSDKKQKHDGDGLHSQEHRCREYAASRGYEIEAVFHDDVTGGGDFMQRPGMVAMLRFMEANSHDGYVVIFDDLKRFARDTIFHLKLRQELAAYGASVECLNFKFEDTPEGQFVETVIAAQGQLERLQNRRQTLQKMKARLERGYYVFAAPVGYRYKKLDGHGRMLVRDEPLASIFTEALEGYASGRFQLQAEVRRFLASHPEYPRDRSGEVRAQRVTDLLKRPIYAGYVEAPDWGVTLRKGHHEPLISFETWRAIQDRMAGNAKTPARKNLSADFPLRGAVVCGHCGTPLTACWATGKYSRYPYYLCPKRGCESYGKSIRRDAIEGEFEALLHQLQPAPALFSAARAMFEDLWNHRLATAEARGSGLKTELAKIERDIERFLDRIAQAQLPSVITAYENRIRRLEERKIEISEKIASCGSPLRSFDETLRTSLDFLANPCNFWASDRLEHKKAVLKLAFADRLSYVRNEGFRTPDLALPFKVLADLKGSKCKLARPERFELPTPGFVGRCSIQLSYGRVAGLLGGGRSGSEWPAPAILPQPAALSEQRQRPVALDVIGHVLSIVRSDETGHGSAAFREADRPRAFSVPQNRNRHHLAGRAGQKAFGRAGEFLHRDVPFAGRESVRPAGLMHGRLGQTTQIAGALAGRDELAVDHEKHVAVRCFGDQPLRIQHQAVIGAERARLDHTEHVVQVVAALDVRIERVLWVTPRADDRHIDAARVVLLAPLRHFSDDDHVARRDPLRWNEVDRTFAARDRVTHIHVATQLGRPGLRDRRANRARHVVLADADPHPDQCSGIFKPCPVFVVEQRHAFVAAEDLVDRVAIQEPSIEHRHAGILRASDYAVHVGHALKSCHPPHSDSRYSRRNRAPRPVRIS